VPEITLKLFAVRQMPHANQMGDFPLSRVSSGVGPCSPREPQRPGA